MDFLQTIFKTNISLLDPVVTKSNGMKNPPEFDASYDPLVTKSKGMLKTPECDTLYDPIVMESKGMQKTPEFNELYDPIVTKSEGKLKQSNSKCSKLYFYSKRFRFVPSFNYQYCSP